MNLRKQTSVPASKKIQIIENYDKTRLSSIVSQPKKVVFVVVVHVVFVVIFVVVFIVVVVFVVVLVAVVFVFVVIVGPNLNLKFR